LDDHQSTIDGYIFRLSNSPNIEVVATASYGEELGPMVESSQLDLLLLDVSVPTSPENSSPYPILHEIPKLLQKHTELDILIISMHNQRTLIKAVMETGASGYILKDDRKSILKLGEVITSVASGGVYFSQQSYKLISENNGNNSPNLTKRQKEVLSLCASRPNSTTAEIAGKLDILPSTVRNLLSSSYLRLEVTNRTAAILKARELGLITPSAPHPQAG
jgi:DNA-binding NarL/FixJ family response regulator